jgi:hypothetical protein
MKYLAFILILVLMASMPSCKFLRDKKIIGKKKAELEALQQQQKMIRVADSLKAVEERLQALEQARLDSARIAEEERLAMMTRYNIVVGAFITPEYARDWVEEYRNRGYEPSVIPLPGTSFELVVAEAHESSAKAYRRLTQFLDTVQIDAWVYERN